MNQDRFFVYVVKNDVNSMYRLFTDNKGVTEILKNGGILSVLRSVTNQYALLLEGDVVWVDVQDGNKKAINDLFDRHSERLQF